jgi:hypothetical protein
MTIALNTRVGQNVRMAPTVDPHAVLETLKRRRAEIDAEIEAVERFIRICGATVGEVSSAAAGKSGKPRRRGKAARSRTPAAETPSAGDGAKVGRETIIAAVREILAASGKPLGRQTLLHELTARGIVVGGKNPLANLHNMLWRSKEAIVNLPGHGHWLVDADYPPADYRAAARES